MINNNICIIHFDTQRECVSYSYKNVNASNSCTYVFETNLRVNSSHHVVDVLCRGAIRVPHKAQGDHVWHVDKVSLDLGLSGTLVVLMGGGVGQGGG